MRVFAIIIEIIILAGISWAVLNGLRLAALDLGIRPKYRKAVTLAFLLIGGILAVFFIAHLVTFYPEVS